MSLRFSTFRSFRKLPSTSVQYRSHFSGKRNYSLSSTDFPGKPYQQINPANGQKSDLIPTDTEESISKKFANSKKAQKQWAQQNMSAKKQIFERYADLLTKNAEDLAAMLSKESGKPITQARNEIKGI